MHVNKSARPINIGGAPNVSKCKNKYVSVNAILNAMSKNKRKTKNALGSVTI